MITIYKIQGMTCESCVKTVTEALGQIKSIGSVKVILADNSVEISSPTTVDIKTLQNALKHLPKYQISELGSEIIENDKSLLQIYKPLILIFAYIFLLSITYQISVGTFNLHTFMNHIMAGFFIGLSFFKFLDLKKFAESFSSYDPVAQRFLSYGLVYPFIELALGLLFISGFYLLAANTVTIIILSLTTYGVWKSLQRKSKIQCACAGAGFQLPLSMVTVAENVIMILMAMYSLIFSI